MQAHWLNQKEIDKKKWDELVDATPNASIYVKSFFLDAIAIDWDAYIADDFSFAIPVGVVHKGRITRVYPPLFQKYMEPIGDYAKINQATFEQALLKRYSKGNYNFTLPFFSQIKSEKLIYQSLNQSHFQLKSLAKRMINKFGKTDLEIREKSIDTEKLLTLIVQVLAQKHKIFSRKEDYFRLFDMIKTAEKKDCLYKVAVFKGNQLMGGLIGLEYKNRLLYLKGSVVSEIQETGAMYALINHFIQYGFSKNLEIDFGGSNNQNIRFFNQRFGGKDITYHAYTWDNSPFYYRVLFGIYNKIKGR